MNNITFNKILAFEIELQNLLNKPKTPQRTQKINHLWNKCNELWREYGRS